MKIGRSILLGLSLHALLPKTATAFVAPLRQQQQQQRNGAALAFFIESGRPSTTPSRYLAIPPLAVVASQDLDDINTSSSSSLEDDVLQKLQTVAKESKEYSDGLGLGPTEATIYGLFMSIRQTPVPLGLSKNSRPFCLRHDAISRALGQDSSTGIPGFFTMTDFEKAVSDDFLDASRGSTDNRKGWQITDVSVPRGESFEEARMTFDDVQKALEKGTVILNAAGAHIPKLAGPSLACTDATLLPCAMNLYVTETDKRTSAPPHTDKQDVLVVQTQGRKNWKVFAPPNPAIKPASEIFARGKMDDSLPLYKLAETCELLLETTLNPGDVLFVPAGFPHTTTTVMDDDTPTNHETSVHLTLGIDHHIWELDYLQTRRLALRRACVTDTALGHSADGSNPFVGKVNELPDTIRSQIMAELPLGLLDDDEKVATALIDKTTAELERISTAVDAETAGKVDQAVWRETVERVRQQGMELLETHRDMYLAAIQEGRTRDAEDAMTAHVQSSQGQRTLSPERMQRLSLFRVKRYYDQINKSKQELDAWSLAKAPAETKNENAAAALAADWALTMPVKVGDEVEANLGGAYFPATVTGASSKEGGTYDVKFFDGDSETGLDRSMIKLLTPPKPAALGMENNDENFPMSPKQLKRWKKQQEKLKKKGM